MRRLWGGWRFFIWQRNGEFRNFVFPFLCPPFLWQMGGGMSILWFDLACGFFWNFPALIFLAETAGGMG
jgi:hypothetical protein